LWRRSVGDAAPEPLLSFHEAWGLAKERPDYHKPDWNRASHTRRAEVHLMAEWLVLVRGDDSGRLIALGRDGERADNIRAAREQMRLHALVPELTTEASIVDMAWLDGCPAGQRRELRVGSGETYVVDRRAVDVRTLVEILANLPQRSRDHVHAILDLLENEGVGAGESGEAA
jgi:hypothetical protein